MAGRSTISTCSSSCREAGLDPEREQTLLHPSDVELGETVRGVMERVEALKPKRVVFDSLSELRLLAQNPLRYRRQILALKHFFASRPAPCWCSTTARPSPATCSCTASRTG